MLRGNFHVIIMKNPKNNYDLSLNVIFFCIRGKIQFFLLRGVTTAIHYPNLLYTHHIEEEKKTEHEHEFEL